jgi:hypothetical protein
VIFDDDVPFAADVLGGRLDVGPNSGLEESTSLLIDHGNVLQWNGQCEFDTSIATAGGQSSSTG